VDSAGHSTEPFYLRRGLHACLLLHGFTGDPGEMRGLGEYLASAGHSVLGLRLPGHGEPPEVLAVVRRHDWLAAVNDAYEELRTRYPRVSLVGFSFGGALSILAAARHPPHRLVLLATPTRLLGDWRVGLLGVVRHTTPWYYPLQHADFSAPELRVQLARRAPDADLDDPEVQAQIRRAARISLHAVDELRQTLAAAMDCLPHVSAPALVMQGRDDAVVPRESPTQLMATIGSSRRELVWWEHTGHQLLVEGPHRLAIFQRVAAFLAGE
jgi:carboxylesterase